MNNDRAKSILWLTDLLRQSSRKHSERQVGLEIERLALWKDGSPFLYRCTQTPSGDKHPGAKELLLAIEKTYGWEHVAGLKDQPIGLKNPNGKVSLEPGSQFEYAVFPEKDLQSVEKIVQDFDRQVDEVIAPWKGLCFIGLGINPVHKLSEIDVIPARRYEIMTEYLGRRGTLGTTMMRRSSSVQINLDYTSEEEAIEMLQVGLLATPLSYAIFGNSPFLEGKETGFLSFRGEVWRNTDPDRSGLLAPALEPGFNFEKYSEILWQLPLMFAQTPDGEYVPAEGHSLSEISEGRLPGVEIDERNLRWSIQQLFTEARLKPGYIEIRSVDGQLPHYRLASAAFWMGLLYDSAARKLILKQFGQSTPTERWDLWVEASRIGLAAKWKGTSLQELAVDALQASRAGLVARGRGEEKYLNCTTENVRRGENPASKVLHAFHSQWKGNMNDMLKSCRLTIEKTIGEIC